AGDGYALASALDDIVDHSENTAAEMVLYGVEAPMEQAVEFTEVLVGAGEQIAQALRSLRTGTELGPHLVEIHRLENEGDRLQRDGVASLFAGGIDPMVVIRWKDIFESLEAAVDACETVAHVLEGITLKQRGPRREVSADSGGGRRDRRWGMRRGAEERGLDGRGGAGGELLHDRAAGGDDLPAATRHGVDDDAALRDLRTVRHRPLGDGPGRGIFAR